MHFAVSYDTYLSDSNMTRTLINNAGSEDNHIRAEPFQQGALCHESYSTVLIPIFLVMLGVVDEIVLPRVLCSPMETASVLLLWVWSVNPFVFS